MMYWSMFFSLLRGVALRVCRVKTLQLAVAKARWRSLECVDFRSPYFPLGDQLVADTRNEVLHLFRPLAA